MEPSIRALAGTCQVSTAEAGPAVPVTPATAPVSIVTAASIDRRRVRRRCVGRA